ncbi:glycine receptor subunit alpha-4-like isoform X2 [Pollicipes pollicipes]|uniref:glycine receptor subunit alpha-4-like isoform X2 n=1 Tax=Pollicipes pollicipes TaxID=41117 RepID=UPI001885522F|nr:glycine receptor subunit alpha-4-like isoform X2 [Pollicipes pollicipes]
MATRSALAVAAVLLCSLPGSFTLEVLQTKLRALQYDANQWPTFNSTPAAPTKVKITIHVNSFGAPQASTMDYELDIYLRQEWQDERLSSPGDQNDMLIVSRKHVIDQLWTPDLYFLNLKDAKYHEVTMPNVLMRIYRDGSVFYSIRLKLSLSCQMKLEDYPLDTQQCGIQLATYAHPTSALEFEWSRKSGCDGICYGNLEIPQFHLGGVQDLNKITLKYDTGNFSALSASFTLDRENGYHILQTYVPTMLMVCMSWVSFWLEQTATPARVTLGVTTLLTLTSLAAGVRSELPPVSYLKAIDVWIGTCMIFVFGALLEFVLVHYLAKKRKFQGDRRKSVKEMFFSKEEGGPAEPQGPSSKKQTHIMQAKVVDRVCRVVMPLAFLTFNIIYWSVYGLG